IPWLPGQRDAGRLSSWVDRRARYSRVRWNTAPAPVIGLTSSPAGFPMSVSPWNERLGGAVARYRTARQALHTPASVQSRRGLDWMNFFVADVQTGFGTFVAFYLAQQGWSHDRIGLALSVGNIAGVLSQIPGGALTDALTWKRSLTAIGIVSIGIAALLLAL